LQLLYIQGFVFDFSGTDVREFLLDLGDTGGSKTIIAVDLRQDFIDIGQKSFKGPTKGVEFRAANFLDPLDENLKDVKGKVNLLYTGAVFHLFQEDEQRIFAEKIDSLLQSRGRSFVKYIEGQTRNALGNRSLEVSSLPTTPRVGRNCGARSLVLTPKAGGPMRNYAKHGPQLST
jgi:hypothetical protein